MKKLHSIPNDSAFRKSSFSGSGGGGGGGCVSIAITEDNIFVRDTKDNSKKTLTFNYNEWKAFLKGIEAGEFDL